MKYLELARTCTIVGQASSIPPQTQMEVWCGREKSM